MHTNQYLDTTFLCVQQCCLAYKFNEDINFTCHRFNTSYIKRTHGEILDNRECHQFNASYIKGTHGKILDNRECHQFNAS
jgi:hypothetical protein